MHNITEFLFHDNIYINYIQKNDIQNICAISILHISEKIEEITNTRILELHFLYNINLTHRIKKDNWFIT